MQNIQEIRFYFSNPSTGESDAYFMFDSMGQVQILDCYNLPPEFVKSFLSIFSEASFETDFQLSYDEAFLTNYATYTTFSFEIIYADGTDSYCVELALNTTSLGVPKIYVLTNEDTDSLEGLPVEEHMELIQQQSEIINNLQGFVRTQVEMPDDL